MMNSLQGANKLAFTGNMNSLLKGTKHAFLGDIKSVWRNKLAFSGNMTFLMGIDMVVQEIIDSDLKTNATVGSIIMVNTENGKQ